MNPDFQIGPEPYRKYIIAIRDARVTTYSAPDGPTSPWPKTYQAGLEVAKHQYDHGLIEMIQGREGPTIIQYAIPLLDILGRMRVKRKKRWFRLEREN